MTGELAETNAIVFGASRGIGRSIANAYADRGATLAVAARSIDDLEELSASVPVECLALECDVCDEAAVERTVGAAVDEFGHVDVAVNSVGAIERGRLHEVDDEALARVVDVNLLGAMLVSKHVLPSLVEREGTLVHVSSEAGSIGVPELPAYAASKGGIDALVRQLAVDYGPDGVSVVGIAPGTTKTELNEVVRDRDPTWVSDRAAEIPYGRLGTPEDVSALAVFLARDGSDYLTGEVIAVDGGSTA